jgi:hypothetical protein
VTQIDSQDWIAAEQQDRQNRRSNLTGLYLAGPWLAVPALLSIPILMLFGDGDYTIPVLGAMWLTSLICALRIRKLAPPGSVRRTTALWVAVWSSLLVFVMFGMAITFWIAGQWR